MVVILAIVCGRQGNDIDTLKQKNNEQTEKIAELEEEKEDLIALREELSEGRGGGSTRGGGCTGTYAGGIPNVILGIS